MLTDTDFLYRSIVSAHISSISGVDISFSPTTPLHSMFINTPGEYGGAIAECVNRGGTETDVSKLLFNISGKRGRVTPVTYSFKVSRIWFVTSISPLRIDRVNLPYASGISMGYGGVCQQGVTHYHYVMVTNHNFMESHMRMVNPGVKSIESVNTTVARCIRYIRTQLTKELVNFGDLNVDMKGNTYYPSLPIIRKDTTPYVMMSERMLRHLDPADTYELTVNDVTTGELPNEYPVISSGETGLTHNDIEKLINDSLGVVNNVWGIVA